MFRSCGATALRPSEGDSLHRLTNPGPRSDARREMSTATSEPNGWIAGTGPRLEVLSTAPLVLQTPVDLLAGRRITDKSVLFVSNCQNLDDALTLDPVPLEGWQIELDGLIRPGRVVISAEDLLDMDQVEYEMVLQCSGNGRSRYPGIPVTPWG